MTDLELMYLLEDEGYEATVENLLVLKEGLESGEIEILNEKLGKIKKAITAGLLSIGVGLGAAGDTPKRYDPSTDNNSPTYTQQVEPLENDNMVFNKQKKYHIRINTERPRKIEKEAEAVHVNRKRYENMYSNIEKVKKKLKEKEHKNLLQTDSELQKLGHSDSDK